MAANKGKLKQTYFEDCWLQDPNFKGWVGKIANDKTSAECKICKKSFKLSNMGSQALTSHMNGGKHRSNMQLKLEIQNLIFGVLQSQNLCGLAIRGSGKIPYISDYSQGK